MTPVRPRSRPLLRRPLLLGGALVLSAVLALGIAWAVAGGMSGPAGRAPAPGKPDFGPDVIVFSPGIPQGRVQAAVNSIASQQVSSQFGNHRYALLFEPG